MANEVFIKQASRFGFGEEATLGTAPGSVNKWFGIQNGEISWPFPEYEVKDYRGAGLGLDAITQAVMSGKMMGSLPIVIQNLYPVLWALGTETVVAGNGSNGADTGYNIHQVRGSNVRKSLTLHQVLGSDNGSTEVAINWLGCLVEKMTLGVEEEGALYGSWDFKPQDYDDTATPASITAPSREPYLWDSATWGIYNTGTTLTSKTALTGLTAPIALQKWEYTLSSAVSEVRGHRSTKARFPITQTKGSRKHELSLTTVPAHDWTLWQKLVRDRTKFDFAYRLTRTANQDYVEFRFKDCYAKTSKHNFPEEDKFIPVDLPVQPRVIEVDVVDSYATLLASA